MMGDDILEKKQELEDAAVWRDSGLGTVAGTALLSVD